MLNPLITSQRELAHRMRSFLDQLPASAGLETVKDADFLYEFEAARLLIVRELLLRAGVSEVDQFKMLDFGYLHGLTQEFLHLFFPGASLTCCDRPESPIFSDPTYLKTIHQRDYLKLVPCDINDVATLPQRGYRVVFLGEIIEHLDPTQVGRALTDIRKLVEPGAVLIITTPNGAALFNWYMSVTGGDHVVEPPIPNALMGYGHIHLWSERVLKETAEYCGWSMRDIRFYHGREAESYARANRRWISFKVQVFTRSLHFLCNRFPRMRAFFVASFIAR